MDRPIPPGVIIHNVDFNIFGVMAYLPDYASGDFVCYGGMIYRPVGSGKMIHTSGDGDSTWGGSCTEHQAEIRDWGKPMFYCS